MAHATYPARPLAVVEADGNASTGRHSRVRAMLARLAPPGAVLVAFVGIWTLVSYTAFSPDQRFLLPPPAQVVRIGFLDWTNFSEILDGLRVTGLVALLAFVLSSVIGIGFAIAMSEAKWIERSFYPFAVALQTLPFLAIVPLVGFWFGYDTVSEVVVTTIVSLFPITTNTLFGLQSTDLGHADLFRLHSRSRLTRLVRLRLPGALPSLFNGLRISAGLCVIASIVTGFFIQSGTPGIGGLLDQYAADLQSERLLAALIMTSALGILIYLAIGAIAHRIMGKWHTAYHLERRDD